MRDFCVLPMVVGKPGAQSFSSGDTLKFRLQYSKGSEVSMDDAYIEREKPSAHFYLL